MGSGMSKSTLLAIDDSPDNLFLLEELIETYLPECELVTARSAQEGLALASSRPFDGAIIDVQLPGMDGLEVCRRLKAQPQTERLPVILITAKGSTPRLRAEGLVAGADHFISRPMDNEELVAKIRVMLRLKQVEKGLSSARAELEAHVQARTAELEAANRKLNEEIAERRRTEAALQQALEHARRRAAETAALLAGVRAVMEERTFEAAARAIFTACKELLGATAGYVSVASADGKTSEIAFMDSGTDACNVDPNAPMPIRGLRARAFETGRVVYENDFPHSQWADLLPPGHSPLENVLFAPLIVDGRVVGLLGVSNKPGGFTDDDARMAAAFGEFASIALCNSRTLHSLETSEKRFRSVVETASDAILYIDQTGSIVFCNRASSRIFGYACEEMVGRPLTLLMPERYREAHHAGFKRFLETRRSRLFDQTIELVGLRKDGSEFPMELSVATWETDATCYFTGIIRDVSSRKQAEHRLHRSERELAVRNQIADAFLTSGGDEVFDRVLRIVLDALDSRHGVFGYIDEAGNLVAPSMTEEVFAECRMERKTAVFPPDTWGDSIWGRAISEKRVLYSNQPFKVPPGHIAMDREISSPIIYQDRVIGLLNVANKPSDYDENDVALLRAICHHIAPILHARLHRDRNERQRQQAEEALRRAHQELEDRVRERTAELTAANDQLQVQVAERQRAEEALRETNALLERVFETTQVSLAYIDTNFRFLRVNRAYAEHDQRSPDFFPGKNHFDLYPNTENEAIFRRVVQTGEPVEFYGKPFTYASNPERGVSYWDWSLLPVKNAAGQVEGLLLCLVDVTQREVAERRARQHQAELAHVSRLSTMNEMGSAIAHELNQPLCAILTSAQASLRLLKSAGNADPLVLEAIEQVVAQSKRAGDIIRHLREFSRRRPFHRSTIHMEEVIREAAGFVAAEARPHNVAIHLKVADNLPPVLGDTIQLEQVLVNLMHNGIEAMENTEESRRRLDIEVSMPEPDKVEVAIRDTGRGLPEGDRERIFEPFFSTKAEGMGIGLAISRSIIEFHGGWLWATPAPDGGAVFRFVLPAGRSTGTES